MAVNEATLVILKMVRGKLSRPLPPSYMEERCKDELLNPDIPRGSTRHIIMEGQEVDAAQEQYVGYLTKWVSKLLSTHRGEAADNQEVVIRKWVWGYIRHGSCVEPLEIPDVSKSRYDMKSLKEMYSQASNKEDDVITKWVDDYIKDLHRRSSTVRLYLLHIESHKERLDEIMNSDSFLNEFTAFKIFHERVSQQYKKLLIKLLGRSAELKDDEKKELKKLEVSAESGERTDVSPSQTTLRILEKLRNMLSDPGNNRVIGSDLEIDAHLEDADLEIDADNEKKDLEYIKIWVDDYIRNIQHKSSTIYLYLRCIERDSLHLEEEFRSDYSSLKKSAAFEILRNRVNQLYGMFFTQFGDRVAELKDVQGAKYLYESLDDDLSWIRDFDRVIGGLSVSHKEIGIGSNGTIVLEGYYHRRRVAVKRLLKTHHDVGVKEIYHLIESEKNENIVRYYGMESDEDFVYICLERCDCTLYDLISKNREGQKELEFPLLLELMRNIVSGVTHLHSMGIVHRDLKPQNVLVILQPLTAKISDMGISKKLNENATSLTKHATGRGTSGWQPQEVLNNGSQSENVDLFSLGCILFFCITRGKHPFGEDLERDSNIAKDIKDLSSIEKSPEAFDLISRLLNSNPNLRPKAQEVIHHLFFWNSKMLETFLHDISNKLDSEDQNSQLLPTLDGVLGGEKWTGKIDQQFLKERNRYRQSRGYPPYIDSVQDLLRLIRNSLEHYNQFTNWSKGILGGSSPEGVLAYFRSKFPTLFVGVHKVIWEHCAQEERLYGGNAKWKWKWNQRFDGPST